MAKLYGREYTKNQILELVGDISQVCYAKPVKLTDGNQEGVDAVLVSTGSGLSFMVLPGRGMGISNADFKGSALGWMSSTGEIASAFYEPEGLGWLRGFYGGLLATCGLTYIGAPCEDNGEELGLHGRASYTPARNVWVDGKWDGDDYWVWVQGKIREATVFGENLVLTRKISAKLGDSKIFIEDTVENLGFERTEHMFLYHFNIGFPLLDEGSEFIAPSISVTPRDEEAAVGQEDYYKVSAPVPGYKEKVYYHELASLPDGSTKVGLINRNFNNKQGLGIYIAYSKKELPNLVQWKMVGQGHYVMGIEPANSWVSGRDLARKDGTLKYLEPGEKRSYKLEIGVLESQEEIEKLTREIKAIKE
ncbi:MAG: hypothetical protein PWR10_2220 [Halanaerobiales bacterium]|nr:hypothetical protein [Halanaerobiales bacterium]